MAPLYNQTNTRSVGALGGTRTPTAFQPLGPEPSASTNSATSASSAFCPASLGATRERRYSRTGGGAQAKSFDAIIFPEWPSGLLGHSGRAGCYDFPPFARGRRRCYSDFAPRACASLLCTLRARRSSGRRAAFFFGHRDRPTGEGAPPPFRFSFQPAWPPPV